MKRIDAVFERIVHVMDVPGRRLSSVDPDNDAVRIARREADWEYDPAADRVEYEAHEYADGRRVTARMLAHGSGGSPEEASPGREWRMLEHKVTDVPRALEENLTVADLRELGREHDVSYRRGSRKSELAEQFAEQAPEAAFRLAAPR